MISSSALAWQLACQASHLAFAEKTGLRRMSGQNPVDTAMSGLRPSKKRTSFSTRALDENAQLLSPATSSARARALMQCRRDFLE